jgi:4-amino-4-deoxy-L-arabinose transferase-like glycosyltransferase
MRTVSLSSHLRRHRTLWLALAAFASSAVLVNPLREMPLGDDWAFALTVKQLLVTGRYEAHDFLLPSMPFQAYWGALFAALGGYSFGVLRVSTLTLGVVAVAAFYCLALYHDLESDAAGTAAFALAASPLFFRLSYSFDTDVPFLACWISALLGFTVGIARVRPIFMLMGAAAGAAAILTRQFGVALIPALVVVWLLDPRRRDRLWLYCLGVFPLLVAATWQFWEAMSDTHWGRLLSQTQELRYLADPKRVFLQLFWRLAVVLHYLALFSIALLPVAASRMYADLKRRSPSLNGRVADGRRVVLFVAIYLAAAGFLGRLVLRTPSLMPYLPWNLSQLSESTVAAAALTTLTFGGGLYLAMVLYRRYVGVARPAAAEHWLIDLATFFLLAQHLLFYKIGDRYLLGLLPLALIAITRHLRDSLSARIPLALVSGLAVLAGSLVWTRGILAYQEARWSAAESARLSGISPAEIYGPWTWIFYYRFPEYLADIEYRVPYDESKSMFDEWLPKQESRAQYHVIVSRNPLAVDEWEVTADVAFRDILFRTSHAYLARRRAGAQRGPS